MSMNKICSQTKLLWPILQSLENQRSRSSEGLDHMTLSNPKGVVVCEYEHNLFTTKKLRQKFKFLRKISSLSRSSKGQGNMTIRHLKYLIPKIIVRV